MTYLFVFLGMVGIWNWIVGYRIALDPSKNTAIESGQMVIAPWFSFVLCGSPKAPNVPSGVMPLRSLILQLSGIEFALVGFGTTLLHWESYYLQVISGVLVVLAMIALFVRYLAKNSPYSE